jgi:hypothetical protein
MEGENAVWGEGRGSQSVKDISFFSGVLFQKLAIC